ncbi:leucine-rich repeat domain-containing protein [Halosquirtibacter xylanolyticus]|uniref:leucine-rich repeat protein n=1 Tax=Halosquirtibacter xylanolyticus TaxID=3374599 RepID=UPI0037488685|nr:leucine-rich repeat domain-containing protein [Prolixibacteraceae bacterium]
MKKNLYVLLFILSQTLSGWSQDISQFRYEHTNIKLEDGSIHKGIKIYGYNGEYPQEEFRFPDEIDGIPVLKIWQFGNSQIKGRLILPKHLLSIGESAFQICDQLIGEIIIPESVVEIGEKAFEGCRGFTGPLNLPKKLKYLGANAFSDCSKIVGPLYIPASVKEIPDNAFTWCRGLKGDLIIPEGITSIGDNAFSQCESLNGTLSIPSTVKKIGVNAFGGCRNITGDLVIPNGVKTVESSTFNHCGFDGQLHIPESVTSIGQRAFYECNNLIGALTLPSNLATLKEAAFFNCTNLNGALTIPSTLVTLPKRAFENCNNLIGDIVLPEGISTIPERCFYNCRNLSGVLRLPSSVKVVEKESFTANNYNKIVFSNQLESIGANAFKRCHNVTGSIDFPKTLKVIGYSAFELCENISGNLIFPPLLEVIGSNAFKGCPKLVGDITIGKNVKTLGSNIFNSCTGLTGIFTLESSASMPITTMLLKSNFSEINIPNGVVSLDNGSALPPFNINKYYNHILPTDFPFSVKKVTLGKDLRSLSGSFFQGFYNIEEVVCNSTIPPTITEACFEPKVFSDASLKTSLPAKYKSADGWKKFSNLNYNASAIDWGYKVFVYEDEKVREEGLMVTGYWGDFDEDAFVIPTSIDGKKVIAIGADAFKEDGAHKMKGELVIPEGIRVIGSSAFKSCTNLSVPPRFPSTLSIIEASAFEGCSGLSGGITFPSNLKKIGNAAFKNCSGLDQNIVFADEAKLQSIGDSAFESCSNITGGISIPINVATIGKFAFAHCRNLDGVLEFKKGTKLNKAEDFVFYGCEKLKRVKGEEDSRLYNIGAFAFGGCSQLEFDFTLAHRAFNIGPGAFYGCRNMYGKMRLLKKNQHVGLGAFVGCTKMTSVSLGDYGYPSGPMVLTAGTRKEMLELIQTIGVDMNDDSYELVKRCASQKGILDSGLKKVTKIVYFNQISGALFAGCNDITQVFCSFSKPPIISKDLFEQSVYDQAELLVCDVKYYQESEGWSQFKNILPDPSKWSTAPFVYDHGDIHEEGIMITSYNGLDLSKSIVIPSEINGKKVLKLKKGMIRYYHAQGALILPKGLRVIDNNVFNDAWITGDLVIPSSVVSIGDKAFFSCNRLDGQLIFEEGSKLETIGKNAFTSCRFKGDLRIPASVKSLGEGSFDWCYDLDGSLYLEEGIQIKAIPNNCFNGCKKLKGNLNFPETLIKIGDNAFSGCEAITGEITIPSTVQYIGTSAFESCRGLTGSIELPSSIKSIESSVFKGCSGLSGALSLNNNITSIGESAFRGCSGLSGTLSLNNNITSIGESAFRGCSGLTENVTIPSKMVEIAPYSFYGCSGIEGLTIPEGVTQIGTAAFYECSNIQGALNIPSTVKEIGDYSFTSCQKIDAIHFDKSSTLERIGMMSFMKCKQLSGVISFPNTVVEISYGAFAADPLVNGKIVMPTSIKYLGNGAFSQTNINIFTIQDNIKSLEIGGSVKLEDIEPELTYFKEYDELSRHKSQTLPKSLEKFVLGKNIEWIKGDFFLYSCTNIDHVVSRNTTPPKLSEGFFYDTVTRDALLSVPTIEEYSTATPWKNFRNIKQEGSTDDWQTVPYSFKVGENTITGVKIVGYTGGYSDEEFVIPTVIGGDIVYAIGDNAFKDNHLMKGQLTLSSKIREIGKYAFQNCSNLKGSLKVPDDVLRIDDYAFAGCSGFVGELDLNYELEYLGTGAFMECSSFKNNITIPYKLTEVKDLTFYGCRNIRDLSFSSSKNIKKIGVEAFAGCAIELQSHTLPASVTHIRYGAFAKCKFYNNFTLPQNVTHVGFGAFSNTTLKNLTFPDEIKEVHFEDKSSAESYFSSCEYSDILSGLKLHQTIMSGKNTFSEELETITIGENITSMDNGIFDGCEKLLKVTSMNPTPPRITKGLFEVSVYRFTTLFVNDKSAYRKANGWKEFANVVNIDELSEWETSSVYETNGDGNTQFVGIQIDGFNGNYDMESFAIPTMIDGRKVVSIGPDAFKFKVNLMGTLHFPRTLKTIHKGAFERSQFIVGDLDIPASVEIIDESAFKGCSGLNGRLIFQEGSQLKKIGKSAFQSCSSLKGDIIIPNGVKTMEDMVFASCTALDGSLTLPTDVTKIGNSTFMYCENLKGEIFIGSSVEEVGNGCFADCKNITSVKFVEDTKLKTIGALAFSGCDKLAKLPEIPNSVKLIHVGAFSYCSQLSGELKLPTSIEEIGKAAYIGTGYNKLVIPDEVNEIKMNSSSDFINPNSFSNAKLLEYYPNYIKLLKEEGCMPSSLQDIHIGRYVTALGDDMFKGCSEIQKITAIPVSAPSISSKYFDAKVYNNAVLHNSNPISYDSAKGWKDFTKSHMIMNLSDWEYEDYVYESNGIREEGIIINGYHGPLNTQAFVIPSQIDDKTVLAIGDGAFSEKEARTNKSTTNKHLKGVLVLPSNIRSIGSAAFERCEDLTGALNIPTSVHSIGAYAFYSCIGIDKELNFGRSPQLSFIGPYAFYSCTNMKGGITIPSGLTAVEEATFFDCHSLDGTLLFDSKTKIKRIGASAFFNCKKIKTLQIEDNSALEVIDMFAFASCSQMNIDLKFIRNAKTIESGAFYDCSQLRGDLTIPNTIEALGFGTFSGCPDLKKVQFEEGLSSFHFIRNSEVKLRIMSAVFNGANLSSVIAISKLKPNYYNTFFKLSHSFNTALEEIILPSTLTEVPDELFAGITTLDEVICDAVTPPVLHENSFNMSNVDKVKLTVPMSSIGAYKADVLWSKFFMDKSSAVISLSKTSSVNVYTKDGNIQIDNDNGLQKVEVYNMMGVKLSEKSCRSNSLSIPLNGSSILLIRLIFQDGSIKVVKI